MNLHLLQWQFLFFQNVLCISLYIYYVTLSSTDSGLSRFIYIFCNIGYSIFRNQPLVLLFLSTVFYFLSFYSSLLSHLPPTHTPSTHSLSLPSHVVYVPSTVLGSKITNFCLTVFKWCISSVIFFCICVIDLGLTSSDELVLTELLSSNVSIKTEHPCTNTELQWVDSITL